MQKTIFIFMFVFLLFFPNITNAKKLNYELCVKSNIKFDDGDTFECNGKAIRILGIDTPEIKHPSHGINRDQPHGREASAFTKDAMMNSKRIVVVPAGKDYYGRTLAHVLLDGELLAVKLIKAGLAYETVSRYGTNKLDQFALEITEAWKTSKKPNFTDPYKWRKKNQKKK